MMTRNWSRAAVLGGIFGATLAACAAQTQDGLPTDTGGTSGRSGTSGAAGTAPGSAGMATIPNAGTSGSFLPPAGGAPSSSAGAPNTGPGNPGASGSFNGAGAPGSAGAPATGAAGAPATVGGCAVAAGTITDLLIDDLDDHDNAIKKIGQRSGYWYTYNDGSAVQVPPPSSMFVPAGMGRVAGATSFSAKTSGPAFTVYGAGMGFDFNNTMMKSCVYNASAYTGIKFWAMAAAPVTIKAMVKIAATTAALTGGTCVATVTAACDNHYALTPAPALTTSWTEYTMPFAALSQDKTWGVQVPTFDKMSVIGMQFQVDKGVAFDFSIDDLTFY